jgi:hypothetical protein
VPGRLRKMCYKHLTMLGDGTLEGQNEPPCDPRPPSLHRHPHVEANLLFTRGSLVHILLARSCRRGYQDGVGGNQFGQLATGTDTWSQLAGLSCPL